MGRVWTEEELKRLGDICIKHNVIIISDEIHADFVWDGHKHTVFANLGESYDSETKTWYGDPASFVDYVDVWRNAGAEIIGGCCRTTPEIIRDIARKIHK